MADSGKNIVALMTLYYPDTQVLENIKLISKQVSSILLIDNTPNNDNFDSSSISNAKYFPNHENLGLSPAFNKCLLEKEAVESDYVIFFDQDSKIEEKHIETLVSDFEGLSKSYKVGYLGPSFLETNTGEIHGVMPYSKEAENNCWTVPATITSSIITKYEILKEVGFWNEKVFLDYADLDLGWRLTKAGFTNFVTKNVLMVHKLGNRTKDVHIPFRKRPSKVVIHKPYRLYYQVRDGLRLILKPYVPKSGKRTICTELILRLYVHLAYLDDKYESLKCWFKGFFDGVRGVCGPIRTDL